MGAKRNSQKTSSYANVVNINFTSLQASKVKLLPRNTNQEQYVINLMDNSKDIVFGIGPAGTGKTLLAVQAAIKQFKEKEVDKIIITRPAVSVDEDLGFLPGTLEEKMAPWTIPVMSIFEEYYHPTSIKSMLVDKVIEIAPLAYMRGRTFKNSFIIADEVQLTTLNQMKMLLTRIGEGSKMAITGDLNQSDRLLNNGLRDFLNKLEKFSSNRISITHFNNNDIERHPVVEEILQIYNF